MRDYMDRIWGTGRKLVEERRSRGDTRACMIDDKLDEYTKNGWPMSQVAFNNLFGELMEAGADTTANQILTIILALAMNPDVQVKARKELDAVCGTERAPLFSDFDQLPYINAIVKEGLRWRPTYVSPIHPQRMRDCPTLMRTHFSSDLGLPHTVTKGRLRHCSFCLYSVGPSSSKRKIQMIGMTACSFRRAAQSLSASGQCTKTSSTTQTMKSLIPTDSSSTPSSRMNTLSDPTMTKEISKCRY